MSENNSGRCGIYAYVPGIEKIIDDANMGKKVGVSKESCKDDLGIVS